MNKPAERIDELEDELAAWEGKPSPEEEFGEIVKAVKEFCMECPLKEEHLECVQCYLHKWKDGKTVKEGTDG